MDCNFRSIEPDRSCKMPAMLRVHALFTSLALLSACASTKGDHTEKEYDAGAVDSGKAASREAGAERDAEVETTEDESDFFALCPVTHPEQLQGECPENYRCMPARADGIVCALRLRTYQECRSWGGEVMSIPDAGGESSECPETHVYIGVVFERAKNPANCCEPIESYCAANDATYEGSSPCENGSAEIEDVQWDGESCVFKAGCTCVGSDCGNGRGIGECRDFHAICLQN